MATNARINVFLTGASSGIGLETARLLTARGCSVWGTSRDLKRLPALPNFHAVTMDLTDRQSIRASFAAALQAAGHFNVLINNAGSGHFGPIETQSDDLIREQFQLLVYGPLELIQLALPQMRQQQTGLIINITSLAGRFPVPYLGLYSATKAALISLSESLRIELVHTPIRVIDLQPGDIQTNFHPATRRFDISQSSTGDNQAVSPSLSENSALRTPHSALDQARLSAVWKTIDRNMAAAPRPRLVAEAILRIITSPNPSPVVTAGNFFQTRLGPLFARLAPPRLVEWALRRYYRI